MIKYDPRDWFGHLFNVRGSVIGEIAGRVMLCGVWAFIIVAVDHYAGLAKWMEFPETGHSLIGVALRPVSATD